MNDTLFEMPPVAPKGLGHALSKPQCKQILATAVLVHHATLLLRGDGTHAGHSVVIDSIPAFTGLGIAHEARTAFAALSGLIRSGDIEELRGEILNGIEVPHLSEILAEARAMQEGFAAALEAAAAHVRKLELPSSDE